MASDNETTTSSSTLVWTGLKVAWYLVESGQGVGLVIKSRVRLLAAHCGVRTWMGDRLLAGKPSRYVTGHLGQLSRGR